MKSILLLLSSLILLFASCNSLKKNTGVAPQLVDTLSNFSSKKLIKDKELFASVTDLVPLDTVYISKDTLHVLTKKIIGCDEDDFSLFWNGAMLKSLPPQTNVKLFQKVESDCNERHHFHLTFNIQPLQFKQVNDGGKTKITGVRIGGWKNLVKYEFGSSAR